VDKPKTKALGTIDAVENGISVDVSKMYKYNKTVTVVCSSSPAWNGTVQIQSSMDGVNWVQEGANVTATAVREITSRMPFLRIIGSVHVLGNAVGSVYSIETVEN
jgi:hypothetical protein